MIVVVLVALKFCLDTALFQTTSGDRILLAKQKECHDPLIKWLRETFGVELQTTDAMVFRINHSKEDIRRMEVIVNSMVRQSNE